MTVEPAMVPFGMSQEEAKIAELARLLPLEYERCREAVAKELDIRVSVLDTEVEARRPQNTAEDTEDPFEEVEAWPDPVNGPKLLSEIKAAILRFCVLPNYSDTLMAAWVLHAWTHDAADISPILAFISPEKRCGKTTALSVVGALTPKSMHAANMTTSVLFRVIEKYCPTVLIDEADTYLTENDELRGIINGGHNRLSAYVWRSVGDDHDPKRFKVWAPKCIAMIGKLPDTLEDRALVVPLRRKQAGEIVQRFRADRVNDFLDLRRKAKRWAIDHIQSLRDLDPSVPDELDDRSQDNARAICAIADVAGGKWPETVRATLVGLARQKDDEPQSPGILLLRDIAAISMILRRERFGSADLCEALCTLDESPWAEWRRGSPITTRGIAKLLKPFGIKPNRDRIGSCYAPSDFSDAFERYLSDKPEKTATSATNATLSANATEKPNKINAAWQNGTCGTYFDPIKNKCNRTTSATSEPEAAILAAIQEGNHQRGHIASATGLGATRTCQTIDRMLSTGDISQAKDSVLTETTADTASINSKGTDEPWRQRNN